VLGRTLWERHARRPFRRRREAEQARCERRPPVAALAVGVVARTRPADWIVPGGWAALTSLIKPEHAHASSAALLTS